MKHRIFFLLFILMIVSPGPGNAGADDTSDEMLSLKDSGRIVGGYEAEPGAWPWMAALVSSSEDSLYYGQFCGGTLIHPSWVVTAAHCVESVSPESVDVVLGVHDLANDTGDRIKVRRIIINPYYDSLSVDSDIALLELERNASQKPLSLIASQSSLEGEDSTIIGWGVTDPGAYEAPERLQEVSVPIISDETCREAYGESEITDNMLCAGDAEGGKDTCWGDSGGPLMVRENGDWKLAGITSWGEGCAIPGYYGVYTRVSNFRDFIGKYVSNINLTMPESVKEGDGILKAKGAVSLTKGSADKDIVVNLSLSSSSEITLPSSLTIPTGQSRATFDITVNDDNLLDGTQTVTVTARISDSGQDYAVSTIKVNDNESATLTVIIPEHVSEADGLLEKGGTVSVSKAVDKDVPVSLTSGDTSEITVPAEVIIPAGQKSVDFDIRVVYDGEIDETQTVTISASVTGWTAGQDTITVENYQKDYFTEEFGEDNDLGYQRLTFLPDGSGNFYTLCREDVSAFSTDPSGGTYSYDTQITLSEDAKVSFYGYDYSSFFIGTDGYISFGSNGGSSSWWGDYSLIDHFGVPRISGLLYDEADADVTWKQLEDRVAVTYRGTNKFQIEMFFDGTISITYLDISAQYFIAGLSEGKGLPDDFTESNLSGYGCLYVNVPESIKEGEGDISEEGIIAFPKAFDKDTEIKLSSDNPSKIKVPDTVTLHEGYTSVSFEITLLKDTLLDGTRTVHIRALSSYSGGLGFIRIDDNETAILTISIPERAVEGDGLLENKGTVTVSKPPDKDITVSLTSSNSEQLSVPENVIIPKGKTTSAFDVTVPFHKKDNESRTLTVTASVTGWTSGKDTIAVINNDIDYFTEEFGYYHEGEDGGDNDLAFHTLTFTPDASGFFYSLSHKEALDFPTDPSGGTPLLLSDDSYRSVSLSQGTKVSLYGISYTSFYVESNGYIMFESGYDDACWAPLSHFDNPRISGFFHCMISEAGEISWKQTEDRAVVTYDNVDGNSFQIEMFFNGVICITYLEMYSDYGIAGLSEGKGIPDNFIESDLIPNGYSKFLSVEIPASAAEGDGNLSKQGKISIEKAADKDLSIKLMSDNPSELTVPETVTIPAGQTTIAFDIRILDDDVLDGTQKAFVTASASGYRPDRNLLEITDNETTTLTVFVPENATEGDGLLRGQGTVTAGARVGRDVTVWLESDDTTEVTVLPKVVIPAGQSSAKFDLTVIYDSETDDTQTVTVSASVSEWISGSDSIQIANKNRLKVLCYNTYYDNVIWTAFANREWDIRGWDMIELYYAGVTFDTLLAEQDWDMVVFINRDPNGTNEDMSEFLAYIQNRGKAIMTDMSCGSVLGQAFGLSYTDHKNHESVSIAEPELADGLTTLTLLFSDDLSLWSVGMSPQTEAPAKFPDEDAAVVIGNDGRTAAVGFVSSAIQNENEAVRFYENLIGMLMKEAVIITVPNTVTEGDGTIAGQVSRGTEKSLQNELIVSLTSDHPDITVPDTVTIPSGQTFAGFDLVISDDSLLNGTRQVKITARAADYNNCTEMITVNDNETAQLTLSLPEYVSEGLAPVSGQGIISVNHAPDQDVTVRMTSSDTGEITVPETVTIPAGHTKTSFDFTAVYDGEEDGTQTVTVTASVPGWTSGKDRIKVADAKADFFTEQFESGNHLSYQSLTFIPDGSPSFYRLCREPATVFPTDPADGTELYLWYDIFEKVSLSENRSVSFYGLSYSSFYVGKNGYMTFGSGDSSYSVSLSDHFNRPRISGLFCDLYGTVSWKQTEDRVVVTYQNISSNSFQIEMFFDGIIRITYLDISAWWSIAGLSSGKGLPWDFVESDLSEYASCTPVNTLFISVPENVSEGAGVLKAQGRVTVENSPESYLLVELASDDPSEIIVPAAILIFAGETSAAFDLTVADDAVYDQTKTVTITASVPGCFLASGRIRVTDNDPVPIPGDIDHSKKIDLRDALLALKVLAGMNPPDAYSDADISQDEILGYEEVIFILQKLGGMR